MSTMPHPSSDPHLAFTRQFVSAQPALHGFLTSLVHDPHAADDLLQELAERMWRKFHEYDGSRPFVAWGIGFARLLAMEWRRRQQRLPLPLDDETLDRLASEAAEEAPHHDERLDALRACLKGLTERQRAVLRMRYQESMPVAGIANLSNRTQVAVYKMLKHAHQALLNCISETLARQTP
jgi:RNA polymerase sigma-70 factor (ECF subfamily)